MDTPCALPIGLAHVYFRYESRVPRHTRSVVLAKERARQRRHWAVSRYRLGEEPPDDLSASTTASERLAMMWGLALEGWSMAGRETPRYDRTHTRGRVIRESQK